MSAPLQQSTAQNTVPAQTAQPSFLQKKGLLGAAARGGVKPSNTVSPSDVLSPISAKLNNSKQRHFQKGRPVHLASQLSQLASQASPASKENKPKIDENF
ncbi:hypothetical protein L198_01469 [Cryptococcus wingfieldii CBS 7118]|uniref:Uncharacterized protein n=1 Tax=Cryptococcus wingfieldii CBS 7118 TaxID=1295528 RepID=A0A1E3K1A5_9TREE|nr:hypothetical protein L198_01469 [Cryptococcus wingfieldii CBS 7118]ODO06237.1 hypothetical protein L198_01469 [Cryptococcus wingfieldii CBS 7118]